MAGSPEDDFTTEHGCLVRAKWDWTTSDVPNRWSRTQQAYKPKRFHIPDNPEDPFNDGFGVRRSKLKIRGKGAALSIRYESQDGKDFQLIGWSIPFTADSTP